LKYWSFTSIELNSISKFDLFSLNVHFCDCLTFKNWIDGYNWEIFMLTNNIMDQHISKKFIVYKYLLCCLNALYLVVLQCMLFFILLELENKNCSGNSRYICRSILLYINDSVCLWNTLKVSNLQYLLIYKILINLSQRLFFGFYIEYIFC
jgi:hypothetical protein